MLPIMFTRNTLPAVVLAALLIGSVAACATSDDSPPNSGNTSAAAAACAPGSLPTKTAGKLTIGTDKPAYPPWFDNNDPSDGKGFESAVAYQVAQRLGYARESVMWTSVTFNNAIAPGPKNFDFDINEFSITPERRNAVDFSAPYYSVRQVVITTKGSKAAGAKSIADLRTAKIGAQVGTTSYQEITDVLKPSAKPQVFNNNDDLKAALANGTVDAGVVDLPTGFFMTAAEIKDGVIVGQLPQVGAPEQFGLVLDKGSALTACVSQAVDQLSQDGTLTVLEKTWLSDAGAPELK
ncbi:amino acid ABC transporter substrate-binding protein [Actinoplanes sp. TBRC 11911]|nr:amino acid ABC transporter substrate-binding protein [Actinoplanes sp. TBRC 11911]